MKYETGEEIEVGDKVRLLSDNLVDYAIVERVGKKKVFVLPVGHGNDGWVYLKRYFARRWEEPKSLSFLSRV